MEELKELYDTLGQPGQAKLLLAAKKRGLDVTKAQVAEVMGEVRQLFAKPPPQRGHHAANQGFAGGVWQADLIDYSQMSRKANKGMNYVLVAIDLFNRKLHAEPMEQKTPQLAVEAFKKILRDFGYKPSIVYTDDGQEFGKFFQDELERLNVKTSQKMPEDINGIAVVDSNISTLKQIISREMTKDNSDSWVNYVEKAVKAYNSTPHGTTYQEAPKDVEDNSIVKFRLQQDNGRKLLQNSKQLAGRKNKLEEAKGFRYMKPRSTWQRSFKPRYESEVRPVDSIEGGYIISKGKRFAVSRAMPVQANTPKTPAPKALEGPSQRKDDKNREELREFVKPLKEFLSDGEGKTPSVVARHMNGKFGEAGGDFEEKMKELKLTVTNFVKLFPDDFEILSSGNIRLKTDRPRVTVRVR